MDDRQFEKLLRGVGSVLGRGIRSAGKGLIKGVSGFISYASPSGVFTSLIKFVPLIIILFMFIITLFFLAEESGENTGEDMNFVDYGNRPVKTVYKESGDIEANQTGTGDELINEAVKYVGNPYIWGGESLTDGADCSGFTMALLAKFGITLPHNAADQSEMGEEIPLSEIKTGDLLFYMGGDGVIGHVSIYMGNGQIIHASNSKPYPEGGIKISDYNYRTPVKARRFLEPGNGTEEDNKTEELSGLSSANEYAFRFYKEVSQNKSSWQIYDENIMGEINLEALEEDEKRLIINDSVTGDILIRRDSKYSVKDYLGNDEKYNVSPYLLYSMNNYLWGKDYTYPEAFLNPVAHDEDYNLVSLTDNRKDISVFSEERDKFGVPTGKMIPVTTDQGIGTICKYKKDLVEAICKGTYIKEDYFDIETGRVKQREINEEYSYNSVSEERIVLDAILTFSGKIRFDHTSSLTLSEKVSEGEGDKNSNKRKILYKEEKVQVYIVIPKVNGTNITAYRVAEYSNKEKAIEYCNKNPQYSLYGAICSDDGTLIDGATSEKTYKLYKYCSDDSGRYTNSYEVKETEIESGADYLFQYMENFYTYKPVSMDRDTEIFNKMTYSEMDKKTSEEISEKASTGKGSFTDCWEDETIRKRIEVIWDTAAIYGYTEEQSSAILGNMWYESGGAFDPEAVNRYSGAYGICQWLGGRYDSLLNFSRNYFGESSGASFEAQVLFAMMEFNTRKTYTWGACQWLSSGHSRPRGTYSYLDLKDKWETSNDIDELTLAVCQGWERPGDTDMSLSKRQEFSKEAYRNLKGKDFGSALEIISADGEVSGENRVKVKDSSGDNYFYSSFYSAPENVISGSSSVVLYHRGLTREEEEKVLSLTLSMSEGISMEEVRRSKGNDLWDIGQIFD